MPRPMLSDHVLLSKGDDGMPRLILSDRVLLSKGDDGMPCPMYSDRVRCQKVNMSCYARRRPTVCAKLGEIYN